MFRTQDFIKIALIMGIISISLFGAYSSMVSSYSDAGIVVEDETTDFADSMDNIEDIHDDVKEMEQELSDSSGFVDAAYLIVDGLVSVIKMILASGKLLIDIATSIITDFDLGPAGLGIIAFILTSLVFVLLGALYKWKL